MTMAFLIRNCQRLEESLCRVDVRVQDSLVSEIGTMLDVHENETVIDARGGLLLLRVCIGVLFGGEAVREDAR